MISPILPSHDADTVSLRVDVLIAQMAYDYRVSQDAIASTIVEHLLITPSQPPQSSQAPAARTSDPAPADVQAEVSVPQTSADNAGRGAP